MVENVTGFKIRLRIIAYTYASRSYIVNAFLTNKSGNVKTDFVPCKQQLQSDQLLFVCCLNSMIPLHLIPEISKHRLVCET